jgi:ribosomal protein S18 acetylase RimI-like enzyme
MRSLLRKVMHGLFGDYAIYRIFERDLDNPNSVKLQEGVSYQYLDGTALLASTLDPDIRRTAGYAGDEAWGFVACVKNDPVSVCWIWAGKRYSTRNFWPLKDGEAKMVEIVTARDYRGRGLAPGLVLFAENHMRTLGFHYLYARVWHNNTPSLAVFDKAGWRYCALVVELYPIGKTKPLRYVFRNHACTGHSLRD